MEGVPGSRPGRLVGAPRMRGDGRVSSHPAGSHFWGAPHARGWKVASHRLPLASSGRPACAGMEGADIRPTRIQDRAPRMRGDGRLKSVHSLFRTAGAPHARGWKALSVRQAEVAQGRPACAGMEGGCLRGSTRWSWAPRMRGDGRDALRAVQRRREGAPHARGWKESRRPRGRYRSGRPACAGMEVGWLQRDGAG